MKILLFAIFLLTSFCKLALSDEQQIIAMGDVEYGEYLGAECVSCHHQSGANEVFLQFTAWMQRFLLL